VGRPGGGVSGEGTWRGGGMNASAHYWRWGGGAGVGEAAGTRWPAAAREEGAAVGG
jgi:hypothetical protein